MDNFDAVIAAAVTQALEPHIERLEIKLGAVEARISAFVPRRTITESTRKRHKEVVAQLGRRCPCCGTSEVLSVFGEVVNAEYDHFYSRERRNFEETWLICKPCHLTMTDRTPHVAAFQAYQSRAKQIGDGQLTLFDA